MRYWSHEFSHYILIPGKTYSTGNSLCAFVQTPFLLGISVFLTAICKTALLFFFNSLTLLLGKFYGVLVKVPQCRQCR